ncbi:hypothetical protein YC2023_036593 [Brassica napus]
MKPNYHPGELFDDNKVSPTKSKEKGIHIPQLWNSYGKCAEGTIPMRRTKEGDTLRASLVKIYGKKKHRTCMRSCRGIFTFETAYLSHYCSPLAGFQTNRALTTAVAICCNLEIPVSSDGLQHIVRSHAAI